MLVGFTVLDEWYKKSGEAYNNLSGNNFTIISNN